jgi:hypothetical protein
MSRGVYLKLEPLEWSDRSRTYRVRASGWSDASQLSDMPAVGDLRLDVTVRTATFTPSGPWAEECVVRAFSDWPVPSGERDPGLCGAEYFEGFLKWLTWRATHRPAGERVELAV